MTVFADNIFVYHLYLHRPNTNYHMKTITVFLASSNELNYDRNSFQALIGSPDKPWG